MKKKQDKSASKRILGLISEAGMLKRVERTGWSVLGIKHAESVAEHSFRCAVISFALARMEGVFPYKPMLMGLFNDIHEARIGDLHKMAQRYVNIGPSDDKAFFQQMSTLPEIIKNDLMTMRKEYTTQQSKESIIARDADILECLIQAKEYCEFGYKEARKFMQKAPQFLKTNSAKELWKLAKKIDLNNWWINLSDFKR